MPSWFAKVFKGAEEQTARNESPTAEAPADNNQAQGEYISQLNPILDDDDEEDDGGMDLPEPRAPRDIIEPPPLMDDEEAGESAGGIRIKAQVGEDFYSCVFMVDRPVLEGYSAWFPFADMAAGRSPLAERLFEVSGVASVLIHGMNVTVTRDPMIRDDWEETARAIGERIREHLTSGEPVMSETFFEGLPSEEAIKEELERVIYTVINPGIAAHSGAIALDRVEGNTVYIQMMGGCQGCAASTITLKQGIHQAFREAVPAIGAILDETDHSAGVNPYFKELPPGMSANA